MSVKARDLERVARKLGFRKVRQKGSHARWKHPDGRATTIPLHGDAEIGGWLFMASGISNPEIDRWYEAGRRAGAIGGKILGAGGGGFLLFYCGNGEQDSVRVAMREFGLREFPIRLEPQGSKIIEEVQGDRAHGQRALDDGVGER